MTDPDTALRAGPVWRPLCLSHDPATIIDARQGGHTDLSNLLVELDNARERSHNPHRHCDIMIAGFTDATSTLRPYVIVCPPTDPGEGDHQHDELVQVEASWLAIAAAVVKPEGAYIPHGDPLVDALRNLPTCWSSVRVRRLALLLGVPRG